jgi:hypothetical protein
MHRSYGTKGRLAGLILPFLVLTFLLAGIGGAALGTPPQVSQPPPPVSSGPPPSSSDFTLTETLTGPQDQAENPQFPVPPGGTVWDLVNSTCTVSASGGLTSNTYAYIYSEAQRTLPDLYNPNLDNICLTLGDDSTNGVSATGYGGYGGSPPVSGAPWIQFDQIIQDTNVTGFAYAAQLNAGEIATFTLTLQPEVGTFPASAMYQFYPSTPTTGSQQVIKIPGSEPPAGEEYRVDNCALGFTIGTQSGQPVASMVIEPSGFVLCSMSTVTVEALSLTALATGGYSTSQTGPDSGAGQDGTQTVWSSVVDVTPGEWIDADFDAPVSDGGQYMVLAVEYPTAPAYNVTFDESGLVTGTSWSVTFDGTTESSTTTHIEFEGIENGTYAYTVGAVSGEMPQPSSGSVTVNGADTTSKTTFTAVTPSTYDVTFDESGLVSGTSWSVTFGGTTESSTTTQIEFEGIENGTYAYTVGAVSGETAQPSSGSVTVNGADVTSTTTFTTAAPPAYDVTFHESGLVSGTSWSVTLNGSTKTSTATTVKFKETNGTYEYSVGNVAGYTATPLSGSVDVGGSDLTVAVEFTSTVLTTYALTFAEAGLSTGTSWSVTLNGTTAASTNTTLTFTEPNGSYAYTISAPPNFTASPGLGDAIVTGSNVFLDITFTTVTLVLEATTSQGGPVSDLVALVGLNETLSSFSPSIGPTNASGVAVYYGLPTGTTITSVSIEGGLYRLSAYSVQTPGANLILLNVTVVPLGGGGSPTTYPIQFVPHGLTRGVEWWVSVTGPESVDVPSEGASLSVNLPNGSYQYSLGADSGYVPAISSGQFSVAGTGSTIPVVFDPPSTANSTTPAPPNLYGSAPPSSPLALNWLVIGAVGAIAVWLIGMVDFFVIRLGIDSLPTHLSTTMHRRPPLAESTLATKRSPTRIAPLRGASRIDRLARP